MNGSNVIPSGPLFPSNRKNGVPRSGGEGEAGFAGVVADPSAYGSEGIPLGLHKLSREDLEVRCRLEAAVSRKGERAGGEIQLVDEAYASSHAPTETMGMDTYVYAREGRLGEWRGGELPL